ncbi:MAG: N-acetylneuraminate synthase [Acidobacteriota bacterium]|nr:N-acetylneuraminate synthase [Acidobacteriota bacterium]
MRSFAIDGRVVGEGEPCFVIAEAGVNHNGQLHLAKQLIDAAAGAGADAVKFQTFDAGRLVTPDASKAEYQVRTTGAQESQLEMLKQLQLSTDAHHELIEYSRRHGILFLSSPFDEESCDLLDSLGLPAFKLPSGELTNLAYLRHAATKRKPLILSTGMAGLREVATAVEALQAAGADQLALLHCVSAYPTPPADANLRAMATLREAFGVPVGFSDHTVGDAIPIAAVALGACVIEKHLTLDCGLPGPDHQASMEPDAFAAMVRRIRDVEAGLGHGRKEPHPGEASVARAARKSLTAACDIAAGAVLERRMMTARRPGTGLSPEHLDDLVGKTATVHIPQGTLLTRDMLR